ncbi:NAD-dependent succinate-semialdehyde dehydrogenase [Sediminitomix flava]|uniref:Succinate-semialdehyde dehydrogenase/glutarate-semialdehyde dehydrogenase n=1 Tax=Sediminitomix flava TaxID=379075 RepID=A0A315ZE67_SEDFL|nr:NAD-dependent succinate-semialdehyde dehydrogenase [Sediminitomix flava]PWJ43034.1 succinate-semialdehyde dehydrogenase/glutarate-semialdehyde dehydrogenase [Sediminitomix flava]
MKFESINPFTGEKIAEYDKLDEVQLLEKLADSETAFPLWKRKSFSQKAELFQNLASILEERKEQLAELISLEMGKLREEAEAEILKCALVCRFYAENAASFLQAKEVTNELGFNYIHYDAIGGILAIMPWNFPFWQVFRFSSPALMAGNVVLLKHAPNVFGCAQMIEQLFEEAGFEKGVFQSLIVDVEEVETIMEHDHVQGVALTGSEKAGASVAMLAGKNIKRSVLELGGSDPFIVMADANIDTAVKVAVQSRMSNAGQACINAKRFLVAQEVYDEFVRKAKAIIEKLKVGNPLLADTNFSCLARIDLAENLERQLEESLEEGAKLEIGGRRDGTSFEPTLLSNVKDNMTVFREETFGPLMCVAQFDTKERALQIANASEYGLGASVWTSDKQTAMFFAQNIETGNVFINNLVKSDPRFPFGGVKRSGYGRELAEEGIKEFVNIKRIFVPKDL